MHGPLQRQIRQRGREYTIRNATDSGGDRTVPDYSDDGTLVGVVEQREQPSVASLPSGEEVDADLELRAVYDSTATTIRESGVDDYPTKLKHPDGLTYRVLVKHPEDSDVTVLSLERA